MRSSHRKDRTRAGQSLIETCLAIMLIGLIFAGLVQISQIFAANEVLNHAAARGARAKTVGFNRWMVEKAIRVAAIPNAGKMLIPPFQHTDAGLENMVTTLKPGTLWENVLRMRPSSEQYDIERARIPSYLDSDTDGDARHELDYENWDSIEGGVDGNVIASDDSSGAASVIHVSTSQEYPLWVPLHRAFYASDTIKLHADSYLENHYPLYIDDMGW